MTFKCRRLVQASYLFFTCGLALVFSCCTVWGQQSQSSGQPAKPAAVAPQKPNPTTELEGGGGKTLGSSGYPATA